MKKEEFIRKWKKYIKNNLVIIIVTLNNGTEIVANEYQFIYDDAKEYYENDNDCKYKWFKDGVYLSFDGHDVAITRLSNIKNIRGERRSHIQDYFETFDLCK